MISTRYIQTIGRISHDRSELYGRNDANILDLALTFDDIGVNLPDLEEYVQHIEVAPSKEVPQYPTPAQDKLSLTARTQEAASCHHHAGDLPQNWRHKKI